MSFYHPTPFYEQLGKCRWFTRRYPACFMAFRLSSANDSENSRLSGVGEGSSAYRFKWVSRTNQEETVVIFYLPFLVKTISLKFDNIIRLFVVISMGSVSTLPEFTVSKNNVSKKVYKNLKNTWLLSFKIPTRQALPSQAPYGTQWSSENRLLFYLFIRVFCLFIKIPGLQFR